MVPLSLDPAMAFRTELTAMLMILGGSPARDRFGGPPDAFQRRIDPSQHAEASVDPSWRNATDMTQWLCGIVRTASASARSQIFTVPSSLADASSRPTGLNATFVT